MSTKAVKLLQAIKNIEIPSKVINSTTVALTKRQRKSYIEMYPTTIQLPDGSTVGSYYHEPIDIIKLPLDLSTLTEAEKKRRLEKRIPKTKVKIEDDIEDDFDADRYLKIKKSKGSKSRVH